MIFKTCALCTMNIKESEIICSRCVRTYAHLYDGEDKYIKTAWFKELRDFEQRQYHINRQESTSLQYMQEKEKAISAQGKKNIGRPTIDWRIANQVLEIFDECVARGEKTSLRKIAKQLDKKITIFAIRFILMKHREKQYNILFARKSKIVT